MMVTAQPAAEDDLKMCSQQNTGRQQTEVSAPSAAGDDL